MAYVGIEKWSWKQLERHVRSVAKKSSSVFVTKHAAAQMRKRRVPSSIMFEVLRKGVIQREPEPNPIKGNLECRMEHYCAGKNFGVVVALSDDNPDLVVVTVMHIT